MPCPVLSIAATPTPFRITYRAAAPCLSRIEAGSMQEAEMLDAPDRCSRIHGRTALHSQRINLSANHAVFQDHAVPAIRVQAAVDRQ